MTDNTKRKPKPLGPVLAYEDGVRDGMTKALALIPTNWCDSLLTGPERVMKDNMHVNTVVEVLLLAVRKRIAENIGAVPIAAARQVAPVTARDEEGDGS